MPSHGYISKIIFQNDDISGTDKLLDIDWIYKIGFVTLTQEIISQSLVNRTQCHIRDQKHTLYCM